MAKLRKFGPGEAFVGAMDEFLRYLELAVVTPYYLIAGRLSVKEVTGPVGIAVMTEQYRRLGFSYYLALMALITVHLGIINLLPIPVLDGGMILITLIEAARRKPIEEKYYIWIQWAGLVFIILIVVVATLNDIQRVIRFIQGGSFLE
jgi:regulator of sigma E protease